MPDSLPRPGTSINWTCPGSPQVRPSSKTTHLGYGNHAPQFSFGVRRCSYAAFSRCSRRCRGDRRSWLERALRREDARGGAAATRDRAKALTGAGILAETQGDLTQAAEYYQTALGMSRELGDKGGTAAALSNLGLLADG